MTLAPSVLIAAVAASLCLSSCTDDGAAKDPASKQESPYEAGKRLLFNAQTRFEYPKAIELLQQAVARDNANPSARLNLVYALLKQGQYERSETHLKAARSLRATLSDREDLWLDALAARVRDDTPNEIAAWEAVVAAFPEDRWAWYELATSNAAIANYAASAQAAGKAVALEPDPQKWEASWVYYLHSKALFRSGQYEAAIAAAAPGEATPSTWRSGFFRKALAQVMAGKRSSDDLMKEYIEISNAEGRNNTSYTLANIALFHFEVAEYDKAIAAAREAYALEQNSYQAWTLGYLLAEHGLAAQAVALMDEAAEAFPDDPAVLAAQGWALYRAGEFEDARRAALEARRKSDRWTYQVESNLKIIQTAVDDPNAPPAPILKWLG